MTIELDNLPLAAHHKTNRRRNWSLILGWMIVAVVLFAAVAGPYLAPQNPTQTNFILQVGDHYLRPPFAPFAAPGFPLGSDTFGRDLLSRLLWGIAPTLLLVLPVALVRLVLGVLIGLAAGFSDGRRGRFLDTVVSGALAIPVLLVALGGIALVGPRQGLVAFIFGLALNGWAETARFVQEQNRLIKQQPYMEAARAMGGSTVDLLFRHVLRQIMPYIWMMLAFEISGTVLVTAELGFLGYYIGGGMWIEIFDWVSVNAVDVPELGQMLGTSFTKLFPPDGMVFTALFIFIIVFGFNLLGQGLRTSLNVTSLQTNLFLDQVGEKLNHWWGSFSELRHSARWRWGAALALVLLAVVVGLTWWKLLPRKSPSAGMATNTTANPNPWPMERHDPQGSLYSAVTGPQNPKPAWIFQDQQGFSGGPVVALDGTIYQASNTPALYALDPQGGVKWWVLLDEQPVGSPALGAQGEIYVVGNHGTLSTYRPDGSLLWNLPSPAGLATSGPVIGADGKIYYTIIDAVRVVSPQGVVLAFWQISKNMSDYPPRLSPDERWIFLHEAAASNTDGSLVKVDALQGDDVFFSDPNFVVGADGVIFLRSGNGLIRTQISVSQAQNMGRTGWDPKGFIQAYPTDAGATPGGLAWMVYGAPYNDVHVVWIDEQTGSVNDTRLPFLSARVVGVDQNQTLFACTNTYPGTSTCYAAQAGKKDPLWSMELEGSEMTVGAALLPGRMLVATQNGLLYALEDALP